MSRSVNFYYGMSGTFKRTTLETIKTGSFLWSDIKPWKSLESLLGIRQDDRVYAALHLYNLENFLLEHPEENTFYVERGVTDMMYYYYKNNLSTDIDIEYIRSIVDAEKSIVEKLGFKITKTLLVQKDDQFIKDVVFKEPTRAKEFKDLTDYLRSQKSYVSFTKEFNDIDSVIEIENAKDYIESLGIEFLN